MVCTQLVEDMDKPDTRRKILFYLNPESSPAERFVCDEIDRMPQGERGKAWRSACLAGFALRKQDSRLPNMLAELLNENTTFEEMILVMQAVFPEEMKTFGTRRPAQGVSLSDRITASIDSAPVTEQTRDNAKNLFGQQTTPGKK